MFGSKLGLSFAVLAAALVLLGFAADAGAKRSPTCGKRPGDTLAQNASWRVFQRGATEKLSDRVSIYACRRGSRRVLLIDRLPFTTEETDFPRQVVIAGDFIGIRGEWETGVVDGTYVEVFDLGKRVRSLFESPDTETYSDIQLSTTGALLLVVRVGSAQLRLDAYDAAGKRTLESAAFSDPAIGGNTAYWTNTAEGVKSAPIAGFDPLNLRKFPK